ncbi:MAG: plasmid stabilization protein ParE [Rhodospirillaceae bacterium]|nr:MAG: plasmid stabilization protein ParE [Rhodospirillaceae bacterium]
MPKFSLSKQAKSDVLNIARYTLDQFGVKQARSYHNDMDECFMGLSENPKLGKCIDYIRKGYRQYNHKSHIIFYKIEEPGIFIIRVLHKSADVLLHL